MKSIFIRCTDETKKIAEALSKSQDRSLNKQIIHMIHEEGKKKNIVFTEDQAEQDGKLIYSGNSDVGFDANGSPTSEFAKIKVGLQGLSEKAKAVNPNQ
tara:strand:- start:529 stop:825 length:297 start_codon:yes stop_codon:yes gene_type:complete